MEQANSQPSNLPAFQPSTPSAPPQPGMILETYRPDAMAPSGEMVTGRYRIAAVSGNCKIVWTRSGQQYRLDGAILLRYFWPTPDHTDVEPIVALPKEEAA